MKQYVIFLSFIVNSVLIFARGCPEIGNLSIGIKLDSNGVYIESKIDPSRGFWFYSNCLIYKLGENENTLVVMSSSRKSKPDYVEGKLGVYDLYFTRKMFLDNDQFFLTNTDYRIVFLIEAPEGCFQKYVIMHFRIIDELTKNAEYITGEDLSQLIVLNSSYKIDDEETLPKNYK